MKLKKTTGLLLALTLSASAFASVGANIAAIADELPEQTETAEPVQFTTANAELHLPETYEQYLPLENPTSVSISQRGEIAVADGKNIYYCGNPASENPQYKCYTHEDSNISKLQFTENGDLYFSSNTYFYRLNTETMSNELVHDFPCTSFLFAGDKLFVVRLDIDGQRTTVSYIDEKLLSSDDFNGNTVTMTPVATYNTNHSIYLTYHEEKNLLYAADQLNVYIYDIVESTKKTAIIDSSVDSLDLNAVAMYKDKFYYTVNGQDTNGGLFTTNFGLDAAERLKQGGKGFTSLISCNDELYCIYGGTIRKLSVNENGVEFSGYEIAIDSDSPHRLSNSGETVRTKELVAIADADNKRISLYNRLENSYTTIDCINENGTPFVPEHIAIDKEETVVKANDDVVTSNKIAVSCGMKIYEYVYARHTLYPEENGVIDKTPAPHETLQNVKGLNYVYGECYYITEYAGYGSLGNKTSSELHFNGVNNPAAITSDVYGALYVAFGNQVYTFAESDFRENGASGTHRATLSDNAELVYMSLTVDYEGNIWYLDKQGKLRCNDLNGNDEIKAEIDGNAFVYSGKENDYPSSFAISFEDDEIYFNFKNYVVKTNAYALESLPALNKILAGEAKTKTFDLADCNKLYVKVPANSVGFQIDLNALKKDKSDLDRYFPYESYFRLKHETAGGTEIIFRQGALLYEPQGEDGYYVVALYDVNAHSFTANLFKKSKNYIEDYGEEEKHFQAADEGETGYISSSVSLCSSPCLFIAPDGQRLSPLSDYLMKRGRKVNVLGYADGEDREYAFVEVVNGAVETKKGFVPRSYLTKNNPLEPDDFKLGFLLGDAGIILKNENGEELAITEKTEAKLCQNKDGTYTAVVEKDGALYSGTVLSDQISRGETDALRIGLIVILSVLALVIIAGYAFLMFPRKKK